MNRPICECGNLAKKGNKRVCGTQSYYKECSQCLKKKHSQGMPGKRGGASRGRITKYTRQFKEDTCVACGFIAEHHCQLDVDHINGDRTDNNPSNLQTLCANCHRLKTFNGREFFSLANHQP